MYAAQHLTDAHVARMQFYVDDQLEITGELLNLFQLLKKLGEYLIRSISAIMRAASGDVFVVNVAWEGLEEAESTREPVSRVFYDALAVLWKELQALGLNAEQGRALVQRYGLRL